MSPRLCAAVCQRRLFLVCVVVASFVDLSEQFLGQSLGGWSGRDCINRINQRDPPYRLHTDYAPFRCHKISPCLNALKALTQDQVTGEVNERIVELCRSGQVNSALEILLSQTEKAKTGDGVSPPSSEAFTCVMVALAEKKDPSLIQTIEDLLQRMKSLARQGWLESEPTAKAYNALVLALSRSFRREAGSRCVVLLDELWKRYNATNDSWFVPLESTYVSTLTALARCNGGVNTAQRAEAILEEMERFREEHPSLAPSTICANIVLHAWSQCGGRDAARRCEDILEKMESLYFSGREELQPDSTSFNTVIDALARSGERGSAHRAEALLEHMEDLSLRITKLQDVCQPDQVSFNTVLNCWARSRDPAAARRADSILRHMERRFRDGNSEIQPDAATYNTVLTAWSRSKSRDAAMRAEEVLRRMEKSYKGGNHLACPTAMSYNIIINAWAKSKDPNAISRATAVFQTMKELSKQEGREECIPDVFSYTSLIDVLAKSPSGKASDQAIEFLEELESAFGRTREERLKPNIRTYTSVIQAVSRSRDRPERAEKIVARIEHMYAAGESDVLPDVVCYDALINAYGWSFVRGKSKKCFDIYKKMLNFYKSGENVRAKPDIITCNSLLNACAYEIVKTDTERAATMKMVVDVFEDFQSEAPKYGWPNHISYSNVLLNIQKHVLDNEQQADLAEATFWQCCQHGHVSVLVLNTLQRLLPWDRFSQLLGQALLSKENESLHFNFRKLPEEWTRFAPSPKERRDSPSQKQLSQRSAQNAIGKTPRRSR